MSNAEFDGENAVLERQFDARVGGGLVLRMADGSEVRTHRTPAPVSNEVELHGGE